MPARLHASCLAILIIALIALVSPQARGVDFNAFKTDTDVDKENAPQTGSLADPAMQPPVVHVKPGPEYADHLRFWQAAPSIERCPGGRLWVSWDTGGHGEDRDNCIMMVASDDNGRTFSPPRVVIDIPGPVRAFNSVPWLAPDGKLWVFWSQSYGWWDGRGGVWAMHTERSDDPRPVWSPPRRVSDGVIMCKPTALKSGQWLLPVSVWAKRPNIRPDQVHDLGDRLGANVIASHNRGKTWALLGLARNPDIKARTFDEPMIVQRRDGTLWLLARTMYGIGQSQSKDCGRTWSDIAPSAIAHTSARFFIRRLRSGNLILVKHGPIDKDVGRSHLMAFLSKDDGRAWSGGLLLDERKDVAYPDATEAPDGTLYLVYDYDRQGAKQILMATFTEADVAAGRAVSDKVRLRVVVNQATGGRGQTGEAQRTPKSRSPQGFWPHA